MRAVAFAVAVLVPALVASADAAPKGPEPKAGVSAVRYFEFFGGLVGEVETLAVLKETRQGANVTGAQLDVCYAASPTSNRKDRFVVNLTPAAGSKLNGGGETQIGKLPVTVSLVRKAVGKTFTFEGTIKVGQAENKVSSADNTDVSQQQYDEAHPVEQVLFAAPTAFTEQSPASVGARIAVAALPDFAKAVKGENARIKLETLQPDCPALRNGDMVVQLELDPIRSEALVTKLRTLPMVKLAGWMSGSMLIDNAVRLSRANFGGSELDRDKLASALAASAAKTLSASVDKTSWDDLTGELTVKLKRPAASFASLGLTDHIELTFQAGPDKPGTTDVLVVWLGNNTIEAYDEGAEPRMKIAQIPMGEGSPPGDYVDTVALLAALARDLNGKVWDADGKAWK